MKKSLSFIRYLILSLLFASPACPASAIPSRDDSTRLSASGRIKPTYVTQRIITPPRIDGKLDDACWLNEGTWSQNFRQQMPREGDSASQKTCFKILYDDEYIYAAIRAYDNQPDKIDFRPARRDNLDGDIVGLCFDSYYDRRTGFEFDVSPSGGKTDLILSNKGWDVSWNAVWEGKAALEDSAWTAEMKIPFSQLRYGNKEEQVWGLHAWRWINRNLEEDQWELIPRDTPATLSEFGTLTGFKNLKKSARVELMPYAVGGLKRSEPVTGSPFSAPKKAIVSAGIDGKAGLTSDFTLDFTINPDFGQVEADPSVLNLSAFEVFFEEKRPFFLEGKNIFEFSMGHDNDLFYSRRIGAPPAYVPELQENEYAETQDNTNILSAVKVSGKNKHGLSLGIMHSLTSRETVRRGSESGPLTTETAEPFTSYFVSRIQKDYNEANTLLGGMFTAVNRNIQDDHLLFLNKAAYTGGLDLLHQWHDKTYFISAKSLFSHMTGDPLAMLTLQEAPARYMQRPDFAHLGIDSSRTSLTGTGLDVRIGKSGTGHWKYDLGLNYLSPGFDINDIGFMHTTDMLSQSASLKYLVYEPFSIFRTFSVSLEQSNFWNAGGYYLSSEAMTHISALFNNKWHSHLGIARDFPGLDTRILRGGPALMEEGDWFSHLSLSTDMSKKIFFSIFMLAERSDEGITRSASFRPMFNFRPGNNIELLTILEYSVEKENLQYVEQTSLNNDPRYLFAYLDRKTVSLTIRADYGITPDLTIQYYGSPYFSSGKYSEFKRITEPRADAYEDRFHAFSGPEIQYNPTDNTYLVDEAADGSADYSFANPDFSFREFRSNLVARWEYRPGSILYLVWQHSRSGYDAVYNPAPSDNFGLLRDIYPTDVLLLKLNYWFNL
jgi:hypothetical protein